MLGFFKGLFGKTETVLTGGQPRQITVDAEYIRTSIIDPMADITEGFQPLMPAQQGLMSDEEINAVIEYIKTVQ